MVAGRTIVAEAVPVAVALRAVAATAAEADVEVPPAAVAAMMPAAAAP